MANENAIVAVYNTHTGADEAVKALQKSGFDMKKLSIVGKDYQTEEHAVGYYNIGDRAKFWGRGAGDLGRTHAGQSRHRYRHR